MLLSVSDIENIIQPFFCGERIRLWGVKISGRTARPFIQIFIDYVEGGITIDECARVNQEIQDILDMQPHPLTDYRLEVSSPGIDWPMTELWQFKKNIGRIISGKDTTGNKWSARLVNIDDKDKLFIETEDGISEKTLSEVAGARVILPLPNTLKLNKNKRMKRKQK